MIKMIEINEWDIVTVFDGNIVYQYITVKDIGIYHAKEAKTIEEAYNNRIQLLNYIKEDLKDKYQVNIKFIALANK
jgi:hypothetical protein